MIIHSKDTRLQWKRAIVKEILPSKDGQPIECKVQTTSGLTKRAIKDLYPLEMQAEDFADKRAAEEAKTLSGASFEGFTSPKPPQRAVMAFELLKAKQAQMSKE